MRMRAGRRRAETGSVPEDSREPCLWTHPTHVAIRDELYGGDKPIRSVANATMLGHISVPDLDRVVRFENGHHAEERERW
jgi:hypothetical protein